MLNVTNSPTVTVVLSATLIKAISGTVITTVELLEYAFEVALLVKLEPAITSGTFHLQIQCILILQGKCLKHKHHRGHNHHRL